MTWADELAIGFPHAGVPDELPLSAYRRRYPDGARLSPVGHAGPGGTLWVRCMECGMDVLRATDAERGGLILLETITDRRFGTFTCRGGEARYWGATGGEFAKHAHQPRRGAW